MQFLTSTYINQVNALKYIQYISKAEECFFYVQVHAFINTLDPEHIDSLSLQLPIMKENGAHVKINCKALQLMDDYTSRVLTESI